MRPWKAAGNCRSPSPTRVSRSNLRPRCITPRRKASRSRFPSARRIRSIAVGFREGLTASARCPGALRLADAEKRQRGGQRQDVIEKPEQQETRDQFIRLVLMKPDQHCRVEHAETARRVTEESEERCRNKDHDQGYKLDARRIRHQKIHRERT